MSFSSIKRNDSVLIPSDRLLILHNSARMPTRKACSVSVSKEMPVLSEEFSFEEWGTAILEMSNEFIGRLAIIVSKKGIATELGDASAGFKISKLQ